MLIYSANRVPEISQDIINIDNAMKWGFGWEAGPFESWDMLGPRKTIHRMESEGKMVPQWVLDMLISGNIARKNNPGVRLINGDFLNKSVDNHLFA